MSIFVRVQTDPTPTVPLRFSLRPNINSQRHLIQRHLMVGCMIVMIVWFNARKFQYIYIYTNHIVLRTYHTGQNLTIMISVWFQLHSGSLWHVYIEILMFKYSRISTEIMSKSHILFNLLYLSLDSLDTANFQFQILVINVWNNTTKKSSTALFDHRWNSTDIFIKWYSIHKDTSLPYLAEQWHSSSESGVNRRIIQQSAPCYHTQVLKHLWENMSWIDT